MGGGWRLGLKNKVESQFPVFKADHKHPCISLSLTLSLSQLSVLIMGFVKNPSQYLHPTETDGFRCYFVIVESTDSEAKLPCSNTSSATGWSKESYVTSL